MTLSCANITTFLHFSLNFRKDLCILSKSANQPFKHEYLKHHAPCVTGKIYAFRHVLELKKCFQNSWAENQADL